MAVRTVTTSPSQKPKPKTRALHVSLDLHKEVARLALDRDCDKQVAAAEVVRAGLAALRSPQPNPSN